MRGLGRTFALVRAEGPRAALARWRDRAADRRRAASFLEVSPATMADRYRGRVPVLSLIGVPLRRSSGGVELQFLARRACEAHDRPTACLAPERRGWRLEADDRRRRAVVLFPRLPGETPARHFGRALDGALQLLAPRGLHVENPAGLELSELADAALRTPLLLSLHDFSLFCPRPHRLPVTADGDCHWTAGGGCALCRAETDGAGDTATLAATAALLSHARGLVLPSRFLSASVAMRLDGLAVPPSFVVEPSVPLPPRRPWRGTAALRHVAYVGSVQPHKGAALLLEIAPALRAAGLRVSAYGGGDTALLTELRRAGVITRGYYRTGSLPGRLAADAVDLVLLLSLWPESHSLAFDECVAAGVAVLAFDRGALGERLRAGGGVAVTPGSASRGVLEGVNALRASSLSALPHRYAPPTPRAAAEHLAELYRELGWLPSA